jgi:general stress protein 26
MTQKGENYMSDSEIKQQMIEYVASHQQMTLATVTPDGKPLARTVDYITDSADIYFGTGKDSRKVRDIQNNPNVAYTIDEVYKDWSQIQGAQMQGKATIVTDEAELNRIVQLFIEKFPVLADMPMGPDLAIVKITPTEGFFLDYRKGFGHMDGITF